MRKTILSLSVAAALSAPVLAQAQAKSEPDHKFTGNIALVSDYRFRGITQTFGEPALQGGFDYAHRSGIYLGNWNSNISETAGFPNGNLEMDFYGGWKKTFGDWGIDLGAIYYYYPGTDAQGNARYTVVNPNSLVVAQPGKVDNTEIYVGGSWKFVTLKYFHAIDDYFSVPGTQGSRYWDLSANYELAGGWAINGHVGRLKVKSVSQADYTDYKIGVTKDVGGWVFGASFVSTNAQDAPGQVYNFAKFERGSAVANKFYEGGKSTLVLSVGKTF